MSVVYLDSSAAVKLVVHEIESDALVRWVAVRSALVSSALLRTELLRAVRREDPDRLERARATLRRFDLHAIGEDVLEAASSLNPVSLRSLDAIHLATAHRLAADLEAIVTYDRRMIEGARALGLPVASPT